MGQNSGRVQCLAALAAGRAVLRACAQRPGGRRAAGENRRAGRFAERRLRAAGGCGVSRTSWRRRSRPKASPSASPMPGCPAIPPRAVSAASTGRCRQGTEAVILELGANDALRGIDPKLTKAALDYILGKLDARHISVLLAGMQAPRNMGADYVKAFDAIYPALASTHRGRLLSVLPRRGGRRRQAQSGRRPAPERRRRRRDRGAYPAAGRSS